MTNALCTIQSARDVSWPTYENGELYNHACCLTTQNFSAYVIIGSQCNCYRFCKPSKHSVYTIGIGSIYTLGYLLLEM